MTRALLVCHAPHGPGGLTFIPLVVWKGDTEIMGSGLSSEALTVFEIAVGAGPINAPVMGSDGYSNAAYAVDGARRGDPVIRELVGKGYITDRRDRTTGYTFYLTGKAKMPGYPGPDKMSAKGFRPTLC